MPPTSESSGQNDIVALVFSGGGARCFWQAGFWQAVKTALPRPAVVAAVSGGAALATILFAGGWSRFFPRFLELAASSKGNVQLCNLLLRRPVFPHPRISRHVRDLPRGGRELYTCPSKPVPIRTWDFSSPDKVVETFELGRSDGARFLRGYRAAPAS